MKMRIVALGKAIHIQTLEKSEWKQTILTFDEFAEFMEVLAW